MRSQSWRARPNTAVCQGTHIGPPEQLAGFPLSVAETGELNLAGDERIQVGYANIDTRLKQERCRLAPMVRLVIEEVVHQKAKVLGLVLAQGIAVVQRS